MATSFPPRPDKTLIYYSDLRGVNSAARAQHPALICNPLSVRRLLINYFPRICPLCHRPEPKAPSTENKCDWVAFLLCTRHRSPPWRRRSPTIDRFSSPSIRKLHTDAQSRNLWDCRRLMDPLCAAQTRRMADFTPRSKLKSQIMSRVRTALLYPISFQGRKMDISVI